MTDEIRNLVLDNAPGSRVKDQAVKDGMLTMLQVGVRKMLDGITTPDEVARVLISED